MSPRLSDRLLHSQSDERLVTLARAGQDRAFAAIVHRYRPELLALARQLTSDGHAEDVLQQAFLSAFAALRSGAEVRHLRGWLYQIVRNAATKARPRAHLGLDQVEIAGEPLEETVLRRARALAAMSELALLPERQRCALVATALGDHPQADVALSMGISEQAVRQLVHRARTTLRGAITGITPWPLARWLATISSTASGPDIAVGAGAGSSAGAVVKLGALLAATGALATGVAVGPLHPVHHAGVRQSAVAHASHPTARATARSERAGSVEAPRTPQAWPRAADPRRDWERRSRGPAAPARVIRAYKLTAITTTNAGGAGVEGLTAKRGGDVSAPERRATASSENEPQPAVSSFGRAGSSGHDGQSAGGSNARAGSNSDGSRSGTDGGSNPGAGQPVGDVATTHVDTPSPSDGEGGVTPAASSVPVSGTSAVGGDSEGGSSSSDGGASAQSGSGLE